MALLGKYTQYKGQNFRWVTATFGTRKEARDEVARVKKYRPYLRHPRAVRVRVKVEVIS